MCNEKEEKKPVEPCSMASRCPLNGRICELTLRKLLALPFFITMVAMLIGAVLAGVMCELIGRGGK